MSEIEIRNLHAGIDGKEILKGVNLTVRQGQVHALMGPNGTGKSTLLEALARASDIHIWSKPGGVRYQVNRYEKQLYKYLSLEWSNGRVPGSYFGSILPWLG